MDCVNCAFLRGVVSAPPMASHCSHGEDFYALSLKVSRLSATEDILNVIISQRLFPSKYIAAGDTIEITGEFRSKNAERDGKRRLLLYVFASDVQLCVGEETPENRIELCGYLCRVPLCRRTPRGRDISDFIIAVNRRYGRADYLPCVAWGRQAVFSCSLHPGDILHISGRMQSRNYIKHTPDGDKQLTAWEISCCELDAIDI